MVPGVRKAIHVTGEIGLTLLAAGGAVCIVFVIAAAWFGLSIILFSTGSMTPTIPAGSAALVRDIPASEVEVGDIVTVDRPDALPVTHRVVGIAGTGPTRELTLRGDANPTDDPLPYSVSGVREVIFSVPGVAPAIAAAGHPVTLAIVTLFAAGLVTWAFWPMGDARGGPRGDARGGGSAPRAQRRPSRPRGARRSQGARHASGAGAAVVMVAALAGGGIAPPHARAADTATEHVVQGEVLRLTSILDAAHARNLEPGDQVAWIVGVEANTGEPGTVHIDLEFSAEDPPLTIEVSVCAVRWADDECASGRRDVVSLTAADVAGDHRLDEMPTSEQRWLRLTVGLADGGGALLEPMQRSLIVRATGSGDSAGIGPGGAGIAETGPRFAPAILAAAALLLIGFGAAVMLWRRRDRSARRRG